jgi:hypothetical protein
MKKTGLVLLAALAASIAVAFGAAAATRPVPFHVTFPAQAAVSAGSTVLLGGRFACAKPSEVEVQTWILERRAGALAEGRFPVHAATLAEKALAKCTGTNRSWSISAVVKATAPGRFRPGLATACYVVLLRAHGLHSSLASHCATLHLR